ncbi:MAG: transcriptional regulator [Desulfurococcales archaeon]|nr:transcriptional regulator [Desulfurococcales archaeon]
MKLSKEARTIFNPKRFEIVTLLIVLEKMTMKQLKEATGLTWGDLNSNIKQLEKYKIVKTKKIITKKGPRTLVTLTSTGLKAYKELTKYLEETIRKTSASHTER